MVKAYWINTLGHNSREVAFGECISVRIAGKWQRAALAAIASDRLITVTLEDGTERDLHASAAHNVMLRGE